MVITIRIKNLIMLLQRNHLADGLTVSAQKRLTIRNKIWSLKSNIIDKHGKNNKNNIIGKWMRWSMAILTLFAARNNMKCYKRMICNSSGMKRNWDLNTNSRIGLFNLFCMIVRSQRPGQETKIWAITLEAAEMAVAEVAQDYDLTAATVLDQI